LSVPNEENPDLIAEEQKKFLREIKGNRVKIRLTDEISGNEEAIQGMICIDKKGFAYFDISRKPDYGVYFARIKYVDQYVNWFKGTHDRNANLRPELQALMINVVKENYKEIIECFEYLKKEASICVIARQYDEVLQERYRQRTTQIPLTIRSNPRYFYLQGLAAFLAKLPTDRERWDEFRTIGIRFMSSAYIIAPRLSQRDILMAETFIYLKRKEEKLCQ